MNGFGVNLLLAVFILNPAIVQAFEDTPFAFHVEVPDSVLFVFRGEEYKEFDIECFPDKLEFFIGGVPALQQSVPAKDENCLDLLAGIETAVENFKSGMSCSQAYHGYVNNQKNLVWDISEWLEAPCQSLQSDLWLSIKLYLYCCKSSIAPDIMGVFVKNGRGYIRFKIAPHQSVRWRRVPTIKEFSSMGTLWLPFREMALVFSRDLIRGVTQEDKWSHIYAVSKSGGIMSGCGYGLMSRGLSQLKEISEKGEFVKGPIPRAFLE